MSKDLLSGSRVWYDKRKKEQAMTVNERAYAKINLYLDIVGRLPHGFHALETVMQTVSLYDSVRVTATPSDVASVTLTASGDFSVPCGKENLACRAAYLFMERGLCPMKVHITLKKRIPVGAGLAGGSSDAAAVLRALNRIRKGLFTTERLLSFCEELGSDVPFCLLGHTRLCRGRGERMEKLPSPPPFFAVLVTGGEYVRTPASFARLDTLYGDFAVEEKHGDLAGFLSALSSGDLAAMAASTYNIFEEPVLSDCPRARGALTALSKGGALCARMSGSGSAVFGIFDSEAAAERAREALGMGACLVQPI